MEEELGWNWLTEVDGNDDNDVPGSCIEEYSKFPEEEGGRDRVLTG
jgi:hypothetical protein